MEKHSVSSVFRVHPRRFESLELKLLRSSFGLLRYNVMQSAMWVPEVPRRKLAPSSTLNMTVGYSCNIGTHIIDYIVS